MPIVIKSSKEGFRRCGIAHSKAPVTYPDDRFSEEELERLKAEPRLSVSVVPEAEETDQDPAGKPAKPKAKG